MEERDIKVNNEVTLSGKVVSEISYSHKYSNKVFYKFNLMVKRANIEVADTIPIVISNKKISDVVGKEYITIKGEYRSYNKCIENKSKLLFSVLAREIYPNEEEKYENQIFLRGFIVRPCIYRITPLGREIADVMLSVSRTYWNEDYIPAIAWWESARLISDCYVGQEIELWGRIQSREYEKVISEEEVETRTAYEVSISYFKVI